MSATATKVNVSAVLDLICALDEYIAEAGINHSDLDYMPDSTLDGFAEWAKAQLRAAEDAQAALDGTPPRS